MPIEIMSFKISNTALALVIPTAVLLLYLYKRNKKYSQNKKWRNKYFENFNFDKQSKETDVNFFILKKENLMNQIIFIFFFSLLNAYV